MPIFGVSIEKSTLFRGVQQPFANVYYYDLPTVDPDDSTLLTALVDDIVVIEKQFHATVVNFVRGRMWNTGSGSQEGNRMRVDKPLTGAGALAELSSMDKERAYLVQWPAGFNVKGRPVKLRKWYHTCANPPGQSIALSALQNTAELTSAQRVAIQNFAEAIATPNPGGNMLGELCAKSGRKTTGPPAVHRYLEHHQLGDQWR